MSFLKPYCIHGQDSKATTHVDTKSNAVLLGWVERKRKNGERKGKGRKEKKTPAGVQAQKVGPAQGAGAPLETKLMRLRQGPHGVVAGLKSFEWFMKSFAF